MTASCPEAPFEDGHELLASVTVDAVAFAHSLPHHLADALQGEVSDAVAVLVIDPS